MAEEQFTSRRARREAERLAAEQAFEAREVPEQPTEAPNSRADLLSPLPPKKPGAAPTPRTDAAGADADAGEAAGADSTAEADSKSRIDPAPAPRTNHERGPLASDHPVESRPPVHAEDRLDPQRTPLPHFQTRAEKKRYLREHGLSLNGDLSTGAMPVVADEQELAERQAAAEGRLTGPIPEVTEADSVAAADAPKPAEPKNPAGEKPSAEPTAVPESAADKADSDAAGEKPKPEKAPQADKPSKQAKPAAASTGAQADQEHESYDAAGFGGATEEVAARDFEAPVTPASAPRPTTLDEEPYDALSMPYSALEGTDSEDRAAAAAAQSEKASTAQDKSADTASADRDAKAPESGSNVPEVGANAPAIGTPNASAAPAAETPKTEAPKNAPKTDAPKADAAPASASSADSADSSAESEPSSRSRRMPIVQPPSTSGVRVVTAASAQIPEVDDKTAGRGAGQDSSKQGTAADRAGANGAGANGTASSGTDSSGTETGGDDAARALAANPETRPMDAVPEAWSLPNSDYEDEETENPPGARIRASSVTGQDGQILMGEEPSKMPYIVLGVAAFFALALIVIALVMFL
jgi:hypothetical protein